MNVRFSAQAALMAVVTAILAGGTWLAATASGAPPPWTPVAWIAGGLWAALVLLAVGPRRGDGLLLPLAALPCVVGWLVVYRLAPDLGAKQATWIVLGLAVLAACARLPWDHRVLEDYKWTCLAVGVALQAAVMVFGVERNGARLWFQFGEISVQPVEVVKILLVIFLAAFLRQFRSWIRLSLISPEGRLPRRALLLLGIGWAACEGVLVLQKDLGMALLLFGIFLSMFYVSTGRFDLVAVASLLFVAGARVCYEVFGHVQVRVGMWLDPFSDPHGSGYQMVQALYSLAWGGVTGTGLGLGSPGHVPEAATDFVFVAMAEELGLLGAVAVLGTFMALVGRAFGVALAARDEFGTLLAAGLATLLAWQTLIIVCGTVKMAPMTGITLPFMSYGGSSMVSNFLVLGLLWRISERSAGDAG